MGKHPKHEVVRRSAESPLRRPDRSRGRETAIPSSPEDLAPDTMQILKLVLMV